jgi:hypothetical protein
MWRTKKKIVQFQFYKETRNVFSRSRIEYDLKQTKKKKLLHSQLVNLKPLKTIEKLGIAKI